MSDDNANDDHHTEAREDPDGSREGTETASLSHTADADAGRAAEPGDAGGFHGALGDESESVELAEDTAADPDDAADAGVEDTRFGAASHRWPGLVLGVGLIVLALDQLTKRWAQNSFQSRSRHVFWELDFVYTENTGASFSLGESLGPVIAVLVVVIAAVLFWVSRSAGRTGVLVAIGMVLGGSVGNFVDRLFRAEEGLFTGGVIDFIKFTDSYPVFNVADMGIVCGGIAIVALGGFTPAPAKA